MTSGNPLYIIRKVVFLTWLTWQKKYNIVKVKTIKVVWYNYYYRVSNSYKQQDFITYLQFYFYKHQMYCWETGLFGRLIIVKYFIFLSYLTTTIKQCYNYWNQSLMIFPYHEDMTLLKNLLVYGKENHNCMVLIHVGIFSIKLYIIFLRSCVTLFALIHDTFCA